MCLSCRRWRINSRVVRRYVFDFPKATFHPSFIDCVLISRQTRERKQNKIEQSGLTQEELLRAQEELFRSAGDKYKDVASPTEGQ